MWKIEKIVSNGDYNRAVVYGHPNATPIGSYVLEHRVVMENHINRLLRDDEVVHHINGNKKDNRIENLELMNASEHLAMHGIRETSWMTLRCSCCGNVFKRRSHQIRYKLRKGQRHVFCSRSCAGKYCNNLRKDIRKELLSS